MKSLIYTQTIDIRTFTSCAIPPHLKRFLLAEDNAQKTDLSCVFFMIKRATGGAWIECLHSDDELHQLATKWANDRGLPSERACPVCKH